VFLCKLWPEQKFAAANRFEATGPSRLVPRLHGATEGHFLTTVVFKSLLNQRIFLGYGETEGEPDVRRDLLELANSERHCENKICPAVGVPGLMKSRGIYSKRDVEKNKKNNPMSKKMILKIFKPKKLNKSFLRKKNYEILTGKRSLQYFQPNIFLKVFS